MRRRGLAELASGQQPKHGRAFVSYSRPRLLRPHDSGPRLRWQGCSAKTEPGTCLPPLAAEAEARVERAAVSTQGVSSRCPQYSPSAALALLQRVEACRQRLVLIATNGRFLQ